MKITLDTNVLVRAAIDVESNQSAAASAALHEADLIAIGLPALCEFVWVARRGYGRNRSEIAEALRKLLAIPTVVVDRPAAEAGVAMLDVGGDFADGLIAFEGRRLGGDVFLSFDAKAVRRLREGGTKAERLDA